MPDVTTLKTTLAGTYKFAKPIQETVSTPVTAKDGTVTYETHPIGEPVKVIPCGDVDVKVGETFEPTLYWLGRYAVLVDKEIVVKVGESEAVERMVALEALKVACGAEDFDALTAPLKALGFKRPKSKADAFDFAAGVVRLAREDY